MDDDRIIGAYPHVNYKLDYENITEQVNEKINKYVLKTLVSLDIDKDVLFKQTQEINRLNRKLEMYEWISVNDRLPDKDGKYFCLSFYEICNGKRIESYDVLGFTKDAYKLDKYNFAEYKGKKVCRFYGYDSECGYYTKNVDYWMPIPKFEYKENQDE